MDSLHRNKGGAKSKRAEPSEKEGMGLAVGAAMLWCKLRDSSSGAFFPKISEEVKRCIIGSHCPAPEETGWSRRWPSAICGFLLQTPIRPAKQTESESLGAEIADVAGGCDDTNMPRGERMIS